MVIIEVAVKVEEVAMVVVVNFLVVTMVNFLVVANFTMVMVNFHLHYNPRLILHIHKDKELLVRFVVRMATLLWIVTTV